MRCAAELLALRVGQLVAVGYIASSPPPVADAVAALRASGTQRVVAAWLVAPGLFHRALAEAGADIVADPLSVHPKVVDLIVRRYLAARSRRHAA